MKTPAVLVIEDNPINRKVVRVILEAEGYTVFEAPDGATGIELMANHPDLVLQDIGLPDVDGLDLVKQLRALPGGSEIPILAISGFLAKMEQARSLDIGFTDFLFKPVDSARLRDTVRAYLPQIKAPRDRPGRGRRVLLVNDDSMQLKVAKVYLEQAGFHVTTATSGLDALNQTRQSPPEIVVSDVLMPGLDGFSLSLKIRQAPELAHIPVVLYSVAYTDEADRKLAREVGAADLIRNTPGAQDLIDSLLNTLDGPSLQQPIGPTKLPPLETYFHSVLKQLERHHHLNLTLARRVALQQAQLGIIAGLHLALEGNSSIESALDALLHQCLDSAGVSKGAAYLLEPDGSLSLRADLGFAESGQVRTFFGHADLLRDAINKGEPVVLSLAVAEDRAVDLLEKAGGQSMLISPILAGEHRLGALAMVSAPSELSEDWEPFAKAVGGQIGQALKLSRALSDLRDNEERFRSLFEGVPVGLYRATPGGKILDTNPAFLQLVGYPDRETLMAMSASSLYVDPDVRTQWASLLEREGGVSNFESQLRRRDGTVIWVRASARAVRNEQGSVMYYEGAIMDITERKQAEQEIHALNAQLEQRVLDQTAELREAKAFLETLVTLGPSIIFKLDSRVTPTRAMTYVSPNIARLLGYRQEEVLGVPGFWEGHMHPEDLEMFRAGNATALRERRTQFEHEVRIRHRDGTYRWMHSALRIEYDQSGALVSIFGYDQDVTARRAAEATVKEAKLEAERANKAKSEFLSRMSHELRTPLNAILGFAQLLEMDSLSSEQRNNVEYVLKGGRHLLDLINEVLDIARIEAGRLALSLEPVPTREVVEETLDLIRPLAAEMNVQLNGRAPSPSERYILADSQRVKQVLLNFLSNAIKYNHKGGTVTLSYEETTEGRLRIWVSDTGPGIPPDKMERLFIPFERLGAEQTSIQGTGLGLALSKRLVEAMGGTLGVESVVGKGSTFWAEFPVVESPVERLKPHSQEAPSAAGLDASPEVSTVLYVEDNLSNLELIQRLLTRRPGVRLLPAMQGQLGLDLARQHHPDLILLDLHLPDIPGTEVLRCLRAMPETQNIPVVVISADATPGLIEQLLAAGAWQYLTKPLDMKRFLALLDEALKARTAGRAARRA